MKLAILSDVHGNTDRCREACETNPQRIILQLGDLGVGMVPDEAIQSLPKNFRFFVGNHDNRSHAKNFASCVGDFGEFEGIFFVSGADSVDKHRRKEGFDWWADEELNVEQCVACLQAWENSSCEIIISHDCPQSIGELRMIGHHCNTRNLLQMMVNTRRPKLLVHGHHHCAYSMEVDGVTYRGLGIDELFLL